MSELFSRAGVEGFPSIEFYQFGFWLLLRRNGHVKWLFRDDWSEEEFRQFQKESERAAHQAKRISKKVA